MSSLQADRLFKVFGRRAGEAVKQLRDGADRDALRENGTTAAVIDASFTVEKGEIFVVMGLSGSGKSTLLRMLNGLLEPTDGRVLFDGQDLTSLSPRDLRRVRSHRISMVFQHFALFPHRSVLENAAYGLEVQGVEREERLERAAEALELAGLKGWEKSWPDELSGGMQQRVGLARALATDADLLLMDESFSALDPLIRRDMQDQLLELQQRLRKTIIFITHDLNEAMRLGDRIAVMRDGRIVQIGTAEQILVDPANDYVASFVQDVDRSRVLTAESIMEEPRVMLDPGATVGSAVHTLRTQHASGGFVVERGRKLVGSVTEDAVAAGAHTAQATVRDLMDGDPVTVSAGTPLSELFTPSCASGLPVAVTDDDRRLVGVIPRVALLAALGDEPKTVVSLDRHRETRRPAAPQDAVREEVAGA
ncbi:glycine betaine/L-proline ABC transporter ATP-binding protein [Streptomyces sp. SL13]|uniref:Glycine betaine/L-proline ABC transporter ATP-binding protein n=1 Tax=Streptantibioticus silvisoli TaxID=2705255 RepID=A0AA90HFX5_9ACTN|nr:glycine betaine/L-proline ABC transporter ATP-binding protein [Streptantibioticus silvisoli]MDI5966956.1 glycine betaine/L-proline ABC transporter ATP-binding protein [Streptantibioticus silvisoli]MDI5974197.1 glycine betaine/L-proline ABC transporter ATP-binding protein [Streptantibioticus silvisoli]